MKAPCDWIVPDWPAPPGVKSLITTRNGGVSAGAYASFNLGLRTGDDEAMVHANRQLLRAWLPQDPKWLRQVHGAKVIVADGLAGIPAMPVHHRDQGEGEPEPGKGELEGGDAGDDLPAPVTEPGEHGVTRGEEEGILRKFKGGIIPDLVDLA